MAYTSIIPVHRLDNSINYIKDKEKTTKPVASAGSLEEAIDYALNRDKTETMVFEDAIGCTCEDAFADMLATKRRFHKVDGVQGYHLIQSFAAGEVSPELAHLIGLELAGTAASNAGLKDEGIDPKNVIVFLVTLGVAVFGQILFRGFLSVIPILIAIIAGYVAAGACGLLDFTQVREAAFLAIPNFTSPKFNFEAIMTIFPALLLVTSEHIGHQIVTGKIVGRNLLKDPGLHRSLFADFFSTTVSGCLGSVPTTTYGENIGVMAVTKVYSVQVIGGAAVLSICCSFLGKLAALISTIPGPVIGGISFLLYGMIGTSGLRMLVDNHVDYSKSRNLTLTSVVFVTGLSGIAVNFGDVQLTGMVLACVVAMILSLIFYILDKLKLTNDQ